MAGLLKTNGCFLPNEWSFVQNKAEFASLKLASHQKSAWNKWIIEESFN